MILYAHTTYVLFNMLRKIIKGVRNRFYRFRLYYKHKEILDKNKELRNIKIGKRCFILGNGASIKDQDIPKLKNEETFVINNFWNHPNYLEFNPKYYVFIDDNTFTSSDNKNNYWKAEFIRNAPFVSKLPTKFFFHVNAKNLVDLKGFFPSNHVYYLVFNGFFRENLNFNIDISRVIPNTKNVIVAAIITAIYMGFEEIYLLGCEHSFLAVPHKYDVADHFYKTKQYDPNSPKDVKYYEPDPTTSYETLMHDAKILFQNYRLLKNKLASEKPKVKIYNATPNSFLDVFPFVKFEDIKL